MATIGVLTVYSHGLVSSPFKAVHFCEAGFVREPYVSIKYSDSNDRIPWGPHFLRQVLMLPWSHCGQSKDCEELATFVAETHDDHPTSKIVLYGESRGASAILGMLSMRPDVAVHVTAVVLDSPFYDIDNVSCAARFFVRKDVRLPTVLDTFPRHVRVLLVSSAEDWRVPQSEAVHIENHLLKRGINVQHVRLSQGRHGKLMHSPEAETYRNAVRAFYDSIRCETQS